MLKELAIPGIFAAPKPKLVKSSNLKKDNFVKKATVVGLVLVNAILLLTYILGVNNYASTGYEIKALQNKINTVTQDNKKLNLSISERASVANLQTELTETGYSVVKGAQFLQTESNQYSKR
jgi:hypothetical protein